MRALFVEFRYYAILCGFVLHVAVLDAEIILGPVDLDPFVVTSSVGTEPVVIHFDAKAAIQPIPAQDGADFLRHVPGFNVIRKGGSDGDLVLRGQAGSRINVLIDGQCLLGGCGKRMDPPTAYVFPAAYDRVVVIKGPQTVINGPGNAAGVVKFERNDLRYSKPSFGCDLLSTLGSYNRVDSALDVKMGDTFGYVNVTGTHGQSDDYSDGSGTPVHSNYKRWSAQGSVGWTPSSQHLIEVSGALSDGEAAYADRTMDGVKFDRENVGLRFEYNESGSIIDQIEGQIYYNYIDHVMDNYSLRPFVGTAMMPNPSVSNPDRLTWGGKIQSKLVFSEAAKATLGFDAQLNEHSVRKTSNQTLKPYEWMNRTDDASFDQVGIFAEMVFALDSLNRIVSGARSDFWNAEDLREQISIGSAGMTASNPTAHQNRSETLGSGFLRYEHALKNNVGSAWVGLGHVSRFPDYWELFSNESQTTVSGFNTDSEKTTQLDLGLIYRKNKWTTALSLFSAQHHDYILIESNVSKVAGSGTRLASIARNIDARTWGGELSAGWSGATGVYVDTSLAYVRGLNDTDNRPLAQISPLEGRIEAGYRSKVWSTGVLGRFVAAQDQVAVNQGNIAGQDIGASAGFAVYSIHGAWQACEWLELALGIDNILDKDFAEHISRSGSAVAGYTQTTRVNEPGRTFWMRARARF
jgi:iron complex outermembrane receptor protein